MRLYTRAVPLVGQPLRHLLAQVPPRARSGHEEVVEGRLLVHRKAGHLGEVEDAVADGHAVAGTGPVAGEEDAERQVVQAEAGVLGQLQPRHFGVPAETWSASGAFSWGLFMRRG